MVESYCEQFGEDLSDGQIQTINVFCEIYEKAKQQGPAKVPDFFGARDFYALLRHYIVYVFFSTSTGCR